jgi:DNA-binding NarL/FixJ family response regulator
VTPEDSINPLLLSDREKQILRCLVDGLPNKLIARELEIAETAVNVNVKSVLRKVRAANRTQAAMWAVTRQAGLINDLTPSLRASRSQLTSSMLSTKTRRLR